MMGVVNRTGDAWELDRVIHFMGGTPEDRENVARANRRAARIARARRWRSWLSRSR